jgi:hypothetical protein
MALENARSVFALVLKRRFEVKLDHEADSNMTASYQQPAWRPTSSQLKSPQAMIALVLLVVA